MQNAKDTFYEVLRSRIAAGNPERTIVVRGLTRPGVLVEENELVSAITIPDCFRLRWTEASVDATGLLRAIALRCEVLYETAGTALGGGMDRGRTLAAMDGELVAAVHGSPQVATKQNYSLLADGGAVTPMNTNIWWSDVVLGPVQVKGDRVARAATVTVTSYQEAGEL